MSSQFRRASVYSNRGFTHDTFDNAARLYTYSVVKSRAGTKPRPCAKDPNILQELAYLNLLFPQAKFVYMVRDPRAQVVSNIRHHMKALNAANKATYLRNWETLNRKVYSQCKRAGRDRCLIVHYEKLVLDFRKTMRKVVKFLQVEWTDNFLHHETFIGTRIKISEEEWSHQDIQKPIYVKSLTSWTNETVFNATELSVLGGMCNTLGYRLDRVDHDYMVNSFFKF
jgi:hypothetical protein